MVLSVVYFRFTHRLGKPHYAWDEYLYSVREKDEVRVTVSIIVCVVFLCCMGWRWKEGRRWNPVPAHSLLFSKSIKGAARFNVPIRRTNRYQQYYMPSQHTYCGRVWNLIWWWKEGRRFNPVPAHSLLFSKSIKGAARLNVPSQRTNRYQQYYMPSQHTYCGRVWNLIQDCDVQSSD